MKRTLPTSQPLEVFAEETVETDSLDFLLAEPSSNGACDRSPRIRSSLPGVVIGTLVDINSNGDLLVRLPQDDRGKSRSARSVVPIERQRIGAEVVLAGESGDLERPIILGLLSPTGKPPALIASPFEVAIDKERVELTAEREIVLRCGKASITLTRAGKVLIRGAYVLSRSSGANRIKGGTVQIN